MVEIRSNTFLYHGFRCQIRAHRGAIADSHERFHKYDTQDQPGKYAKDEHEAVVEALFLFGQCYSSAGSGIISVMCYASKKPIQAADLKRIGYRAETLTIRAGASKAQSKPRWLDRGSIGGLRFEIFKASF